MDQIQWAFNEAMMRLFQTKTPEHHTGTDPQGLFDWWRNPLGVSIWKNIFRSVQPGRLELTLSDLILTGLVQAWQPLGSWQPRQEITNSKVVTVCLSLCFRLSLRLNTAQNYSKLILSARNQLKWHFTLLPVCYACYACYESEAPNGLPKALHPSFKPQSDQLLHLIHSHDGKFRSTTPSLPGQKDIVWYSLYKYYIYIYIYLFIYMFTKFHKIHIHV